MHSLADTMSLSFKYSDERLLSEALVDVIYLYDNSGIQSFRASPCGSGKIPFAAKQNYTRNLLITLISIIACVSMKALTVYLQTNSSKRLFR